MGVCHFPNITKPLRNTLKHVEKAIWIASKGAWKILLYGFEIQSIAAAE